MNNRFNLFALALCALMLVLVFGVCWEPAEAEEPRTGPPVKVLALDKHKRQRHPPEEPEAQLAPWANRLEGCAVTFYDCCEACCGKTDGITFSGAAAVPYETCAVDPEVIPLGSMVSVDYGDGVLYHYRAEDIGSGVRGKHVDVCVRTHKEALELGTRTATVYWIGDVE